MIPVLMQKAAASSLKPAADRPKIEIGDSVEVQVRILEVGKDKEDKERIQPFAGLVISMRGSGADEMFTVRRIIDGEGVERCFPFNSPKIAGIEIKKKAIVRRAKLYYLRDLLGKKAFTLKERPSVKETVGRKRSRVKARKAKAAEAAAADAANPNTREARKARKKGKGAGPAAEAAKPAEG